MNTNKITGLSGPISNSEPVTKQYGDSTYLTDAVFVMQDNIGMGGHTVTNIGTPTNNTDAATKKYVDDKKCKFSDGVTTTNDVDISTYGFNNGFKFNSGAYSIGMDASGPPSALVNKHSLETAGLIGIDSFSPTLKNLFPHRFLMWTPTSHTAVYKEPLFNCDPTYRTATDGCELILSFRSDLPTGIYKYSFDIFLPSSKLINVFLYGECGGTGYKASTKYKYWEWTGTNKVQQADASGGYFLRGLGSKIHIEGAFRYYGKYLENYGMAHTLGEGGQLFEFVVQKLTANTSEPKLFGLDMSWIFENDAAG